LDLVREKLARSFLILRAFITRQKIIKEQTAQSHPIHLPPIRTISLKCIRTLTDMNVVAVFGIALAVNIQDAKAQLCNSLSVKLLLLHNELRESNVADVQVLFQ
jgi:hypothetical protein